MNTRIQEAMAVNRISQTDLAIKLGISPQAVQQWVKGGTSPKGKRLEKLVNILEISMDWLLTGKGEMRPSTKTAPAPESNAHPAPLLGKSRQVPVVGTAQLGDNGNWTELEYPVGFGDGYINYPTADANAYALRCTGDSMRPRIRDGEFVIIEPNSEPIPGDEVLVKALDGRVMVKTLLYHRDGRVYLMSINENHPQQSLAISEIDKIHPVVAIVKKGLWIKPC